jgi:hypothetical protein
MKYTHSIGLLTKFKNGNENRIVYFKETNPDYAKELIEINKDFAAAISILNGEIRESCEEFCKCGILRTLSIRRGKPYCSMCDKPIKQNSLERT